MILTRVLKKSRFFIRLLLKILHIVPFFPALMIFLGSGLVRVGMTANKVV